MKPDWARHDHGTPPESGAPLYASEKVLSVNVLFSLARLLPFSGVRASRKGDGLCRCADRRSRQPRSGTIPRVSAVFRLTNAAEKGLLV